MDVEKLFQGIAVIFDDEISNSDSTISNIKKLIEKKNIPVAVYNEMPRREIIPSLSNASFVILDWDYNNSKLSMEREERLLVPAELQNEQDEDLIRFIKELLRHVFVPVFIFSSKSEDDIKTTLIDEELWYNDKPNRIFIKQKNEINSEKQFFGAIEEWLKSMPSVYVLKEWEQQMSKSKDKMFLELYGYSPNWVKIIWDMCKEDAIENHHEFGEFIMRNMNNRIGLYTFKEEIIGAERDISSKELIQVIEGERYLTYDEPPQQAYPGDLFKVNNKYYLNIRAQCDLSRKKENEDYNPRLYCVEGKKLKDKEIVTEYITMTKEEKLNFGTDECFSLEDMREICKDNLKLEDFNKKFKNHRNKIFFRNGAFLERNDKVIVGCVDRENALQFNLDIQIKDFKDLKGRRIGRILPPYITRIQQKCAQNMIREGVMPIPDVLFKNINK